MSAAITSLPIYRVLEDSLRPYLRAYIVEDYGKHTNGVQPPNALTEKILSDTLKDMKELVESLHDTGFGSVQATKTILERAKRFIGGRILEELLQP